MSARRAALIAAPAVLVAAIVSAVLSAGCGETGPHATDTGATALATWRGFYVAPTDRIPKADVVNPGTPWGDYLGSEACKDCHRTAYDGWRDSFHSKTLYKATPKTLFGDFSGKTFFESKERPFRVYPLRADGQFAMRIERAPSTGAADTYNDGIPAMPTGIFEVLFAFGNRRDQPYVTRAKDGSHWVLPVVWDDREKAWKWDGWRPYVKDCAGCHVTGVRSIERSPNELDLAGLAKKRALGATWGQRWNVDPQDEGWADGAVGCENCHGPGRGHRDAVKRMGVEGYRGYLAGGGEPTIYNPKNDTPARRVQQCDTCHTFTTESPVSFVPGPKGYGRDPLFEPTPQKAWDADAGKFVFNDAQYYENLTNRAGCSVGLMLRGSKMGARGVECRDCHDPHGTPRWAELTESDGHNQLCLKCHQSNESGHFKDDEAVAAHTRHRIDSPGSLCIECHMPRDKSFTSGVREHGVVQFMSTHMHSHAMSIPTGHESEKGGPTSACNDCHKDRDAAWSQATLKRWRPPVVAPGAPAASAAPAGTPDTTPRR
jgi:predicted CXXCH cytochrome family protein